MRTTVTLEPDVMVEIKRVMGERDLSFKQAVNDLIRRGLQTRPDPEPYRVPTFRSAVRPGVDLDKALALAGTLEDDEAVRRAAMGK